MLGYVLSPHCVPIRACSILVRVETTLSGMAGRRHTLDELRIIDADFSARNGGILEPVPELLRQHMMAVVSRPARCRRWFRARLLRLRLPGGDFVGCPRNRPWE